jgi:hypothetical protein
MTFIDFIGAITWLSPITTCIGSIAGFRYFKSLDIVSRGITVYLAVMFIVAIISEIFFILRINNQFILPIYCLIELILFTHFYNKYLLNRRYKPLVALNILAIFYIIWDIVTFSFTSAEDFQSYAKVFDNFGIILLALTYCYEKLEELNVAKWKNFRLNIIIAIFFTINLIFFLPYNFIINDNAGIQFYFWFGIAITTIIFYIYLTTLIIQDARKVNANKRHRQAIQS